MEDIDQLFPVLLVEFEQASQVPLTELEVACDAGIEGLPGSLHQLET